MPSVAAIDPDRGQQIPPTVLGAVYLWSDATWLARPRVVKGSPLARRSQAQILSAVELIATPAEHDLKARVEW